MQRTFYSKYTCFRRSENPEESIKAFKIGEVNIIVVTLLFTRGYDVDVDVVFNYDLPLDPLDYIHRCGRTGRNGKKGMVITFIDLFNDDDYNKAVVQQITEVSYGILIPSFKNVYFFSESKRKDMQIWNHHHSYVF